MILVNPEYLPSVNYFKLFKDNNIVLDYEGKYNIVNIYPIAFEFFLVSGLLFGYQYYARAVMRFYWYAIFIFIILPFLVNYFSRFFKRY